LRKHTFQKIAALLAGCAMVVVGTDAITYAATGHSLILGKINKAGTTTSVVNTGRGPVLNLVGGKPYPPIKVNSNKRVANFNADLIDGLDSKQLVPGVTRLSIGTGDLNLTDGTFFKVALAPGWYQFSLNGLLNSSTDTDGWVCLMGDFNLLSAPANDSAHGFYTYDQGKFDANGRRGVISNTAMMRVLTGAKVIYGCSGSGTGPISQSQPVTFSYRAVPKPTIKTGAPFDISPRMMHRIAAR